MEFGNELKYMDLCFYKSTKFYSTSKLDLKVFQSPGNKYLYTPHKSGQDSPFFKITFGELERYGEYAQRIFFFSGPGMNSFSGLGTSDTKKLMC